MAKLLFFRTAAVNAFILGFLAIILIDGVPSLGLFHDRAKRWIDPVIDVTGVWQGGWSVFTPSVDRQNHHIELSIVYADGTVVPWRSPNWRELSAWQKLVQFRQLELSEQLESDGNRAARAHFAHYLADLHRPATQPTTKSLRLTYHSASIARPTAGDYQPLPTSTDHSMIKTLFEEYPTP